MTMSCVCFLSMAMMTYLVPGKANGGAPFIADQRVGEQGTQERAAQCNNQV